MPSISGPKTNEMTLDFPQPLEPIRATAIVPIPA
ncbi:hypothetical protein BH20ACT23_BH20ACT23_31280 [soil metagenome]